MDADLAPISFDDAVRTARAQAEGSSQISDDGLIAVIYERPVQNKAKSSAEGRPIFDAVPFVHIRIPGDKFSVVDRELTDSHKRQFKTAWDAFQRRDFTLQNGTPIREWPYLSATRCAELKASGIEAIEQIAQLTDSNALQLGPDGYELRDRAKQWLQPQTDTETELREERRALQADLRDALNQNKVLQSQLTKLQHQIDHLVAAPSSGQLQGAQGLDDASWGAAGGPAEPPATVASEARATSAPAKRGRGRPRKHPKPAE